MSEQNTKNDEWITTGQSASWDEQTELVGRYVRMKSNVGAHNSNVYVLKKDDGSEVGVWGSTVINGRFEEIPLRSMVKIKALGEAKSKQGTTYKDYEIKYLPPKEELHDPFESQEMPPEFLEG